MDALAMTWPDDRFDLVWACESGEHMPDKKRYVEEMARVLKPGLPISPRTLTCAVVHTCSMSPAASRAMEWGSAAGTSPPRLQTHRLQRLAGGQMVIATWCQREETPETPFSEAEKKELQFLYDEWAHPYFISIEEYERLMQARTVIKLPFACVTFTLQTRASGQPLRSDLTWRETGRITERCCLDDVQGTGKLDSVATADWTEPTIPSWRHSIWVGVYDPWRVIRTLSPRIWIKVGMEGHFLIPDNAQFWIIACGHGLCLPEVDSSPPNVSYRGSHLLPQTVREIVTLERMHRAFDSGLMRYGMMKAVKPAANSASAAQRSRTAVSA